MGEGQGGGEDDVVMINLFRLIKRRLAIRSYVFKLSLELYRRWGKRRYYTVDEVTGAALRSRRKTSFIAYAHAIFCAREDFDAHYGPLKVNCTYERLRAVVSRQYFGGVRDFDAACILRANRSLEVSARFYESGLGDAPIGH